MPIPVPVATSTAVIGYAMLIAESPASPMELPTKKPSTMA